MENVLEKDSAEKERNTVNVKVWGENEEVKLPVYGKPGDACCDIYATAIDYDVEKDGYVIHTGLHFALPEGYEMQIRPRSSNTKTDLYLPNSIGTLDQGYRGELLVIYKNRTATDIVNALNHILCGLDHVNPTSTAKKYFEAARSSIVEANLGCPYEVGDRVGQVIVYKRPTIKWEKVETLEDLGDTERGAGGFGSTGK